MKMPYMMATAGLLIGLGGIVSGFAAQDRRGNESYRSGRSGTELNFCRHEQHYAGRSMHCYHK